MSEEKKKETKNEADLIAAVAKEGTEKSTPEVEAKGGEISARTGCG